MSFYNGKHFAGESVFARHNKVDNIRTVRLSDSELEMLNILFPSESFSFAVRSCIHELYSLRERNT